MSQQSLKKDIEVAIIGGGLGGFATAVALQNRGIQAHVYEQAQELGEVGAGIIIHPPTQHIFKQWGLDVAFEKKSFTTKTVELYTAKGEFVTNVTDDMLSSLKTDERGVHPAAIHRAHLLDVLSAPITPEYIHLAHKLHSLAETEEYVEATFENGTVVQADVVIAANGIHSNVRKLFSDDAPVFSGLRSFRTNMSREATKGIAKEEAAVMYRDGDTVLIIQQVEGGTHFDLAYPSEDVSWVKDITKEELVAKMASFDEKLVKMLDTVEYPAVTRALYYRQPIPQWSSKRITLLGDAAHSMLPTLGQGANSAIADAEAIARALKTCPTIEEALHQYENERKPITTEMQNESQQMK